MGDLRLDVNANKLWIQVRLYPVKDGNGKVTSVVSLEEDITERKKAEESLRAYQERLRALAAELTLTEEQERKRMATELHDGAAQSLAFARIQLASVMKRMPNTEAVATLDDLSQLLKESLQQIRDVLLDLSSPALNEIGLGAALSEWLEEQVGRRYGLKTFFQDECGIVLLKDDTRAVLFRNTRELLMNAVKHARAEKVSLRMESSGGTVRITVEDDGIGFTPESATNMSAGEGSYGLFSIRERMADLGGTLEIVSEPGKGCKATLIAPLEGGEERG
jgi:signal transduction histidine kinase